MTLERVFDTVEPHFARTLREMPTSEEAHLAVLRQAAKTSKELFARDEAMLVEQAATLQRRSSRG